MLKENPFYRKGGWRAENLFCFPQKMVNKTKINFQYKEITAENVFFYQQ